MHSIFFQSILLRFYLSGETTSNNYEGSGETNANERIRVGRGSQGGPCGQEGQGGEGGQEGEGGREGEGEDR